MRSIEIHHRVDVYIHPQSVDDPRIDQVLKTLNLVLRRIGTMQNTITLLTQEVADTKGVVESAVVLLDGIDAALEAAQAAGDPTATIAAIETVRTQLAESKQALAAAVARNALPTPTPLAPVEPPVV